MDKSLFGYIWRYSKRQQLVILAITVVSFPILYMTLELPKWIVNDAISGQDFPRTVFGYPLEQVPYLLFLCFVFLGLVVLNNVVKYILNIYKGVTGERMLRRLRYQLFNQVLRFRLPHFRRVSSSEIIPMITAEVEDVGVFIGESIATPAFQGGTLLVYVVFIFVQDPFLGAAAVALYPLQGYIIPKLQRKVVLLARERVKNIRRIADRVGESINGVTDLHANDTSRWHLADLSDRLFVNYKIRLEIFRRKFMIKFFNNFMNQLPPFFFYSVGGYLVIQGELSFGALVAVLAAYKDLAAPWKELLTWYQTMSAVSIKYETVVENFDPEDAVPMDRLVSVPKDTPVPAGDLVLTAVSAEGGGTGQEIAQVTLTVKAGGRLAVYGPDGSGRTELLMVMAGLLPPTTGRVELGGQSIESMAESLRARAIAYVGADPFIFNETIRGNVVYAIRNDQAGEPELEVAERKFRQAEATLTGNSLLEVSAPWEDLERAGVEGPEALDGRLLALFQTVGMGDDLYRLGLQQRIDPEGATRLVGLILEGRARIAERIAADPKIGGLVELWDPERFNNSATLAENVLFALPADLDVKVGQIPQDAEIRRILGDVGLLDDLVAIGAEVARTMIELFSGVEASAELVGDYSFIAPEETQLFEARLRKLSNEGVRGLDATEVADFAGLAFRLVPGRHRLVDISEDIQARIVGARPRIREALDALEGRYAVFDPERYVPPMSIEENLLFGKPRVDRRGASERIDGFLRGMLTELGLRDPVALAGLDFGAGVQGSRLSATQRRRIGLVRALVKRPNVLVVDQVLDGEDAVLDAVLSEIGEGTLVAGTRSDDLAARLGEVAVMRDGRLVESGSWDSVGPRTKAAGEEAGDGGEAA